MNEKLIQQVLQIEKEAQEIHEASIKDAEQLPVKAGQEGEALVEQARKQAQDEARRLVANAEAKEESARILAEANEKVNHARSLALTHFERAVGYVLDRVAGRD